MKPAAKEDVYLTANAHSEQHAFEIPFFADRRWVRFVDTSLELPEDAAEDEANAFPVGNTYNTGPRTVVVLVAR